MSTTVTSTAAEHCGVGVGVGVGVGCVDGILCDEDVDDDIDRSDGGDEDEGNDEGNDDDDDDDDDDKRFDAVAFLVLEDSALTSAASAAAFLARRFIKRSSDPNSCASHSENTYGRFKAKRYASKVASTADSVCLLHIRSCAMSSVPSKGAINAINTSSGSFSMMQRVCVCVCVCACVTELTRKRVNWRCDSRSSRVCVRFVSSRTKIAENGWTDKSDLKVQTKEETENNALFSDLACNWVT